MRHVLHFCRYSWLNPPPASSSGGRRLDRWTERLRELESLRPPRSGDETQVRAPQPPGAPSRADAEDEALEVHYMDPAIGVEDLELVTIPEFIEAQTVTYEEEDGPFEWGSSMG